jgi:hypothetical protein
MIELDLYLIGTAPLVLERVSCAEPKSIIYHVLIKESFSRVKNGQNYSEVGPGVRVCGSRSVSRHCYEIPENKPFEREATQFGVLLLHSLRAQSLRLQPTTSRVKRNQPPFTAPPTILQASVQRTRMPDFSISVLHHLLRTFRVVQAYQGT